MGVRPKLNSMNQRTSLILITGLAFAAAGATPLAAQNGAGPGDYQSVVRSIKTCSGISDLSKRLTCFDEMAAEVKAASGATNNARSPQANVQRTAAPQAASPTPPQSETQAFASETVRTVKENKSQATQTLTAIVTRIRQQEPGLYLITLEDGVQWKFVEGVSAFFKLPKKGDSITITNGSMGGYWMHIRDQERIRVRRLR